MIKNIIFDLDGTLLDTSDGLKEAVFYTVNSLGLETLSDAELDKFIGPPIQVLFKTHFGLNLDDAQNAANIFRDYYKNYSLYKASPYTDIFKTLDKIKVMGKTISVATFKREDYAIKLLEKFEIAPYCKTIHGGDNNNIKTKSDIIQLCMDEINGSEEDTIYVGDTIGDLNASKKLGIKFVAATYGFGFKRDTIVPDKDILAVVDTPKELEDVVTDC